MHDVTEKTLEKRIEFDASPERVWRAITDPAELSQWFGDSAALDLRPGGAGHMTWVDYGRREVRVEVVQPSYRLVWSWMHEPDVAYDQGRVTRVEWLLRPREGGGTVLELRETGFREETHFESNVSGWDRELEELRELLRPEEGVDDRMGNLIGTVKRTLPKGLKDQLWPYYVRLFGHTDYQRFAIIGHARTGSNFLLAGLNSSDSIRMYSEIFAAHKREIGKDFDKVFSKVFRKQSRDTRAVGLKIFYFHFNQEEWQRFLAHREFKIIHLTRSNRLRTILSLDLAFQTNEWSTTEARGEKRKTRVVLDPAELIERLETIEDYETSMRARLTDHSTIEVEYESLVADPVTTLSRVSEFLGVRGTDPRKILIKKQNPGGLRQLIENHDEVADCLRTSRFSAYLE